MKNYKAAGQLKELSFEKNTYAHFYTVKLVQINICSFKYQNTVKSLKNLPHSVFVPLKNQ